MRVSEMAVSDRPATRLRHVGVSSMTSAELLAVLIGGDKALASAHELLAAHGGRFRSIARAAVPALTRFAGIGDQTANRVAAALEIGQRLSVEGREDGSPIRSPRDVAEYASPRMEDLPVEEFHVLVLDSQHRLERDILITRGILNSSLVHPREVFREAIAEKAAAMILLHNHPSGDPSPSKDDICVTEQLVAAGKVLDIPIHDHVIIGRGRYTSFAEAGLL